MQTKILPLEDQLLFVRHLFEYSSRTVNQRIRGSVSSFLGISERSYNDKMNGHRSFRGLEIDLIQKQYESELGKEVLDRQLAILITKLSDGDRRTIDAAKDQAIQELSDVNSDLATSHLLL